MQQLRQHAEAKNISIADVVLANEIAVSGKSEDQINAFLDKIAAAMLATVKSGLSAKDDVLPGPIKLHSKAATVWARAMDESMRATGPSDRRSLRTGGVRGKRQGPSGDNGSHWRICGRDAGHCLRPGGRQAEGLR